MNNYEVIFENIKLTDLEKIILEELQMHEISIISSHFYDKEHDKDINYSDLNSLTNYFNQPGTGNLYMKEINLGEVISNVMMVISFNEVYGDIVLNFSEEDISEEKNHDENLKYTKIVNKLLEIIKITDVKKVIVGYEPATDDDMKILEITESKICIWDNSNSNFKKAMKNYERARILFFRYTGNKYFMWREQKLNEYEKYNIPIELEIKWQEEYLIGLHKRFNLANTSKEKFTVIYDYMEANRRFYQKDSLDFVEQIKEKMTDLDDFTRLRYLETIFEYSIPQESKKRKQLVENCIEELYVMLNRKVIIDESYYEMGEIPEYLSENILKERIEDLIKNFSRVIYKLKK